MSMTPRDVIRRAGRLNGSVASGGNPTADEMVDAMVALNTMKRALFGMVIGPRLSPQSVTGNAAQAENGGEYQIPAGGFALTAPKAPTSGSRFAVVDAGMAFAANPVTILGGGRLLEGGAGNLTLNVAGANRRWWFRGDTGNWVREADYVGAGDPIEFPDALIAYLPYMLAVVNAPEFGTELRADVIAAAAEGRAAFARAYARRSRAQQDPPIGVGQPQPAEPPAGR